MKTNKKNINIKDEKKKENKENKENKKINKKKENDNKKIKDNKLKNDNKRKIECKICKKIHIINEDETDLNEGNCCANCMIF
jgi:hypothetical protein